MGVSAPSLHSLVFMNIIQKYVATQKYNVHKIHVNFNTCISVYYIQSISITLGVISVMSKGDSH